MDQAAPVILIDGSSFLYRAFHVSGTRFNTSKGVPTGAAMVLTRMFDGLIKKYPDSPIIAVFDAKGKSFRSEIYPEYKANRKPMPEELRVQIDYTHQITIALGFPLLSITGVEADDVLGTLAKRLSQKKRNCIICTGDKDLAQVVNDRVTLYDSMSGKYYDANAVKEKFGVGPELMIDLLALKGDTSDNIPGMPGVGEKTAPILLNKIGGIAQLEQRSSEIEKLEFRGSKNFASKFLEQLDKIKLSYRLATIKTDVEIDLDLDNLKPPVKDYETLLRLFEELEFKSLYQQTKAEQQQALQAKDSGAAQTFCLEPQTHQSLKSKFITITTIEQLQELADRIKSAQIVAFDTETSGLQSANCSLIGISCAVEEKKGYYIPLKHNYLGVEAQLDNAAIRDILLPVLNRSDLTLVGHNIKFDLVVMYFQGLEIKARYEDTMVLAHLLDSAQRLSLDDVALRYLNYKEISFDEVTKGQKKLGFGAVSIADATIYSGEDSESTLRLYQLLKGYVQQDKDLLALYNNIERPLIEVLYRMECTGVLVDCNILQQQNEVLAQELAHLQKDIFVSCGEEFNISSPKQLGTVLFEHMAIPYPKKHKEGTSYSTAEEILEQIAPLYDVANLILRYRELSKLISTYTQKLQTQLSPHDGRIHTSFNQSGTVTGRLSSSEPNLQNIPARTQEGKLIREAFIAPPGFVVVAADYSQIELRLIAHFSEDPHLIEAFRQGYDIHKATAAEVLGKSIEDVTAQERSHAKATNFGLMYGMGVFGLQRQTKLSFEQAKQYIDRYFERYPSVRDYMQRLKQDAHQNGYVSTLCGRKVAIPNINTVNTMLQKAAERAAINAPMQGSAADIIKLAMLRLDEWIKTLPENTVRMTVQVHDELVFEVREDFVPQAQEQIAQIMEHIVSIAVPLTVGIEAASSWGLAH